MTKKYSFLKGRRKNYLIDPQFQNKIILLFFILSISVLSIIYLFDSYYFEYFIQKGKDLNLEQGHVYYRLLEEQKDKMDRVFIITSITVTILVVIFGLILSHKIAGPLYRLRQYFMNNEYENGTDLRFRKGDFFTDIPQVINKSLKEKSRK